MESPRWTIITPSQYERERRGLDFIKAGLPDYDPYRAWANFEFQTSDGAIYEVGGTGSVEASPPRVGESDQSTCTNADVASRPSDRPPKPKHHRPEAG
jgi:hypothetical protein